MMLTSKKKSVHDQVVVSMMGRTLARITSIEFIVKKHD
jgi:hypothetical protein